jgi:hypothetical protein
VRFVVIVDVRGRLVTGKVEGAASGTSVGGAGGLGLREGEMKIVSAWPFQVKPR